jgi:N-acetylneuraminate synthase
MRTPFIVAEMSANHLGQLNRALDLVKAAAAARADAIKIQCWHPERMVVDRQATVTGGPWDGCNVAGLYEVCWTPFSWIPAIFDLAKRQGIVGFASVFDELALAELERNGCPIYKIASCEIIDTALIQAVAKTGKPMMISTGMATEREIHAACDAAIDVDGGDLTLLKCTAAYPATPIDCHLRTIPDMRKRFHLHIGLSDHTLGTTAAVVAIALGATVIEKHLTLSRADGGPDAGFSSEPDEFAAMVKACREAAETIGNVYYGATHQELPTLALRRSLHYIRSVTAGSNITLDDIISARPANGLAPSKFTAIIGRTLNDNVTIGQPVKWEDFHGN